MSEHALTYIFYKKIAIMTQNFVKNVDLPVVLLYNQLN